MKWGFDNMVQEEPFVTRESVVGSLQWDKCTVKWRGRLAYSITAKFATASRCLVSSLTVARECCRWRTGWR
jgi:hypothetical protein